MVVPEDLRTSPSSSPARQYHCSACGYGVIRKTPPEVCPMCRGSVWECTVRPFRGDWGRDLLEARPRTGI